MKEGNRPIRAMIVDDEEPARNELRYLLERFSDIVIVAEAESSKQALRAITRTQPHLVFLDIEMPGMNGIELANRIAEAGFSPFLVFATAHEEFAVKAFDINAADYLLKPFSQERLGRCINRVRGLLVSRMTMAVQTAAQSRREEEYAPCARQRLAVEYNGKVIILNVDEIIMACCADGQVIVHTHEKAYPCNLTLQELQAKLEEQQFFRSHRAYLVNTEKIREIIPWFNGTYNLVLDGLAHTEIPVSRQQAPKLRKLFGI
ncbi:LytR/AlgR family response regulator transcription factor [Sporolituus thermophilus]|uniref:Two component transcriptional regulator, LytTR family n=1 Tax=Sporolituus thermophilus DSM 23256 TaxID=1123285 RepID=A0A1G7JLS2_9FIRM|nr:LytTR family DNA-binding domain-containing protein [Sporolituus thermophilus]SDF25892.1 two component transcriptional regulator, LytTR family [Sporolituus thermophilus DSM 23256]